MLNNNWLAGIVVALLLVLVCVTLFLNASGIKVRALEAEVERLEAIDNQPTHRPGDLGKEAWQIIDSLVSFNNLLIRGLEDCENGEEKDW